jgi:hypothetical protein
MPQKRVETHAEVRLPAPREAGRAARRQYFGAKAVGSFLPALTTKAFQKYGFSTVALITDWRTIVGGELARSTALERLKWRRLAEAGENDDAAAPPATRSGATLVLRVDGAKALEVQYQARQIIERINAYFGYAAVSELRLIQAPPRPAAAPPSHPKVAATPLTQEVAGIAHPGLRDALARLGGEIRAVC